MNMNISLRQLVRCSVRSLALSAAIIFCGYGTVHMQYANAAGKTGDRGPFPTGLWYAASDAGIQQGFAFTVIHADGTFAYSSVAETGGSAVFPGEFTPLNGLWTREGNRLVLRGFTIQETETGTPGVSLFAIVRGVFVFDIDGANEIFGVADYDFLPCASETDCPNPDENPLVIGEGVTGGGLPVYFRRISRQDF
jgi:hypothetical protein